MCSNWSSLTDLTLTIGITDPYNDDYMAHKKLNLHLIKNKLPTLFFQHGLIQVDVNNGNPLKKIDYYSDAIFLMDQPCQFQKKHYAEDSFNRLEYSGYIKKPCFTPNPIEKNIYAKLQSYESRVLICHSLRDESRDSSEKFHSFYSMIRQFATRYPRVGIILRSHRGKRRLKSYYSYDRQISEECKNVHLMYKHHGPLKRMVLSDALSLADWVISSPSTAILDSIYTGKPTAVYLNSHEVFSDLFQISNAIDLGQFVEGLVDHNVGAHRIINRFGDVNKNINKTCSKIEQLISQFSE